MVEQRARAFRWVTDICAQDWIFQISQRTHTTHTTSVEENRVLGIGGHKIHPAVTLAQAAATRHPTATCQQIDCVSLSNPSSLSRNWTKRIPQLTLQCCFREEERQRLHHGAASCVLFGGLECKSGWIFLVRGASAALYCFLRSFLRAISTALQSCCFRWGPDNDDRDGMLSSAFLLFTT